MAKNMLQKNLVDISAHFFLSSVFALIIYRISGRLWHSVIFLAAGVLIDLDHLIDYFVFFKSKFNLKHFLDARFLRSGKVYLLLHSWELIFCLFGLSLGIKSAGLLVFSLGLTLHLIVDALQRENPWAYFLVYRARKKFDANFIIPEVVRFCKKHNL